MNSRKLAEWLVVLFFAVVVIIVFQQIMTDMTESGIASGGPYNNAAAYPRAIAIIISVFLIILLILRFVTHSIRAESRQSSEVSTTHTLSNLIRPVSLLAIFAAYLWALGFLGYYIATPLMLAGIICVSGLRKPVQIVLTSIITTFLLAFVFESFLKIVLPGGIFKLNIPW